MADSSTIQTRSKKKQSLSASHKSKKNNETTSKELSPRPETENEPKTDSPTRSTNSPDPNCAICLGKLENKSFTDSCFHMFCFVCLLEWSKVKNECPLCKQAFKSIIHNVRSYEDYDKYHLSLMHQNHPPEHPYSRSFRYRTTLTEDRVFNLRSRVIGNPSTDPETVLQLQAIGAAPNLQVRVSDFARQGWDRRRQAATSEFRRRIYTNGMHLVGIRGTTGRVREASPAFFTRNPALTHRLVPWLNRELNALLYNQESHVQFVLELIMGLIKRFEISGEEFYEHISPFIGRHTKHFMREFEMFAKCPYCMIVYDKKAMYEQLPESVSSDSNSVNSISDDDSDVQIVSTEAGPADRTNDYINLPDISTEIQVSSTVHSPWGIPSILQHASWHSPTPGPSWSFEVPVPVSMPQRDFIPRLKRSIGLSETEIDSDTDSLSSAGSDVMVVAYDKPWEERSPINLSSDSETEKKILRDKDKKSKKLKKKKSIRSKTTPASADAPLNDVAGSTAQGPEIPNELDNVSQTASTKRHSEEPSTSLGASNKRKSKHKSKSWRDSQYNNRINVLFHRRSTSPEMSDSGRRKEPIAADPTPLEFENHYQLIRHSRDIRKRKHKNSSVNVLEDTLASSSKLPESSKHHEKRTRRESRSPSVEIISVHQDKKHKKHKKHKHKHKSSHKHHSKKVKSTVVVKGNNDEQPSQEDTDAYEEDSQTTVDPSSVCSSARTSEASGSARSFTDTLPTVCETLNPVEIATNIAKKAASTEDILTSDGVLDLTAVNLEEIKDDDVIDVGINEFPSSFDLHDFDSKFFKKHPSGHKKSRGYDLLDSSGSTTSVNLNQLPVYTNVMMGDDPLLGQTKGPTFYPNVLESFNSAFTPGFNPHAWYRRHFFPSIQSHPKSFGSGPRITLLPTTSIDLSNDVVDVDSYPLDLRQSQPDSTKTDYRTNAGSTKSSTVTSSHANSSNEPRVRSPVLDVVNLDKDDRDCKTLAPVVALASSSRSDESLVIDISGTEDSNSDSQLADSTVVLDRNVPNIFNDSSFPTSVDNSQTESDIDVVQNEATNTTYVTTPTLETIDSNSDSEIDVGLLDTTTSTSDNRLRIETDSKVDASVHDTTITERHIIDDDDSEIDVNGTTESESEIDVVDDNPVLDLSSIYNNSSPHLKVTNSQISSTPTADRSDIQNASSNVSSVLSSDVKALLDCADKTLISNGFVSGSVSKHNTMSAAETFNVVKEILCGSMDNSIAMPTSSDSVVDAPVLSTPVSMVQSSNKVTPSSNHGQQQSSSKCVLSNSENTSRASGSISDRELPSSSSTKINSLFSQCDKKTTSMLPIDESSSSSLELPMDLNLLKNRQCQRDYIDKIKQHNTTNVNVTSTCTSGTSNSSTSSDKVTATFWKKRLALPVTNSSWRNDETSEESEASQSNSSTDSYDYKSIK